MINKDYKYYIDYHTIGNHDCENHGCNDEGICRCFRIESVDIINVDINNIVQDIFEQLFDIRSIQFKRDSKLSQILYGHNYDIDKYCIDRILRFNKLYDPECWSPSWGSDYYGDELYSIEICDPLYKKVSADIEECIHLGAIKDKIQFLLNKEYGFVLDKLKNKDYNLKIVDKSDIVFGQVDHKGKVQVKDLKFYEDKSYGLIKGICLKDGNKWRVIDGYHRLTTTELDKVKIIGIC